MNVDDRIGATKSICGSMIAACLLVLALISIAAYATAQNVEVSLDVIPVRVIVVGSDQRITQVISNTDDDIYPTVRLDDDEGPILPISAAVSSQYALIHGFINFSRTGTVWDDTDTLAYYPASMSDRLYSEPFEVLLLFLGRAIFTQGTDSAPQ